MEWSARIREAKQETAWAVFVIGVVFNNLCHAEGLPQFSHRNLTQNALINGVL